MIREVRLGLVCFAVALVVIAGGVGLMWSMRADPVFGFCHASLLATCAILAIALGAYWLAGMRFTEPRETTPRVTITPAALLPPRRGATLVSVLASMAIIAICLTLVLQLSLIHI